MEVRRRLAWRYHGQRRDYQENEFPHRYFRHSKAPALLRLSSAVLRCHVSGETVIFRLSYLFIKNIVVGVGPAKRVALSIVDTDLL